MVSRKHGVGRQSTGRQKEASSPGVLDADGLVTRLNEVAEHGFAVAASGLRDCYAEMVRDVEAGLQGVYESTITEIRRASVAGRGRRVLGEGWPVQASTIEIYPN
jgi:hypothetical protein